MTDSPFSLSIGILSAYIKAGRPRHGGNPMGSFEEWDRHVRGAVIWCGLGDPLAGRERIFKQSDADLDVVRRVFACWHQTFGDQPATLAEALANDTLRAVLAETDGGSKGSEVNQRRVGWFFRKHRDRIVDGLKLTHEGQRHSATLWKVVPSGEDRAAMTEPETNGQPEPVVPCLLTSL